MNHRYHFLCIVCVAFSLCGMKPSAVLKGKELEYIAADGLALTPTQRLDVAIQRGDIDAARLALKDGATPFHIDSDQQGADNLLLQAVMKRHPGLVALILAHSYGRNIKDIRGCNQRMTPREYVKAHFKDSQDPKERAIYEIFQRKLIS